VGERVFSRLAGPGPSPDVPAAPASPAEARAREEEEVRGRVNGLLTQAAQGHRSATLGFETATLELGQAFERAAGDDEAGPERARVNAAIAVYREALHRRPTRPKVPDVTASREDAWEQRVYEAREGLANAPGGYAVLVEVRQGADGSLADLRLLASSGQGEFDVRALGSVVRGLALEARSPALDGGLLPGTLSLWELDGVKLPDSALVDTAQRVYRYALLDVVPLRETVIRLETGAGVERVKYSAHLLAVY